MRRVAFLAILVGLMATQADAARKRLPRPAPPPSLIEPPDSVISVRPSEDGASLIVKGWLDVGSFVKFRRVLAANPRAKTVRMASAGGLVQEGVLIGATIREAKLSTRVETLCASACALLFASGAERSAAPEAWIGFHRAQSSGDGRSDELDAMQRATLRRAGIAAPFIETALNTPADGIWFPSREELAKARVLTSETAAPGMYDVTAIREAMERDLRTFPLWNLASREWRPAYEAALELAWRLRTTGLEDPAVMVAAQADLIRTSLLTIARSSQADGFLESMARTSSESCADAGWGVRVASAEEQQVQSGLLEQFLSGNSQGDTPSLEAARKQLRKTLARSARSFPGLRRSSDAQTRCRAGLDLVRRIAAMEGEKRAQMFRAYALMKTEGELESYAVPL